MMNKRRWLGRMMVSVGRQLVHG